jgi:hypothetical protein
MEALTSVPATWFEEHARRNAIPHVRFGKYPRFNYSKVCDVCERVRPSETKPSAGKIRK